MPLPDFDESRRHIRRVRERVRAALRASPQAAEELEDQEDQEAQKIDLSRVVDRERLASNSDRIGRERHSELDLRSVRNTPTGSCH
jgi:hypothetical protein